jgi:hypothetical protein
VTNLLGARSAVMMLRGYRPKVTDLLGVYHRSGCFVDIAFGDGYLA